MSISEDALIIIIPILVIIGIMFLLTLLKRFGLIKEDRGGYSFVYVTPFREVAKKLNLKELNLPANERSERLQHVNQIERLIPSNKNMMMTVVRTVFEGTVNNVNIKLIDWGDTLSHRTHQETIVIMPWLHSPKTSFSLRAGETLSPKLINGQRHMYKSVKSSGLDPLYVVKNEHEPAFLELFDPSIAEKMNELALAHEPFEILVQNGELIVLKSINKIKYDKQPRYIDDRKERIVYHVLRIVDLAVEIHALFHPEKVDSNQERKKSE